ncbi:protein of unknown function [Shewanella benthica]|uniref:Uncharacterized protein n=1 Tax=Shewanella benthica TaxID=43661 RepID=A0A330LXI2_9GAMM|nr:protein of unknown function [Shewanella benthica]
MIILTSVKFQKKYITHNFFIKIFITLINKNTKQQTINIMI